MCIIAYVPSGKQITQEMMKVNFNNNPDGAGVMWKEAKSDKVHIKKGFRTVEDLMNEYYKLPIELERAVHFRIATSGKISTATCHPFPVRKDVEEMKKGEDITDMALMHNGIIPFCTPKGGMSATFSDTMVFASKFLYQLKGMIKSEAVQELIEHADNSRFLIFSKNNEPILLGKWEEKDGIMYSNGTFRYEKRAYSCGYGKDWWKGAGSRYARDLYDGYESGEYYAGAKALDTKITNPDGEKLLTKKYGIGKDLVMIFDVDTSQMDIPERTKIAEKIHRALRARACLPSPTWRATTDGIKIKVTYLPYERKGNIGGYKWTYKFENFD